MKDQEQKALESRVEQLERVTALQTRLIDRLAAVLHGHQGVIEEFGRLAGVEIRHESAQAAPLKTAN
jgi:uncharacterized coiled-coil protein SlyX